MKLVNFFTESEAPLPPPGQAATISTLATFRNIFAFLGLATILFTTVLLMFDYDEVNKIGSSDNRTADTYKAEKEQMLTNGSLMFTSALLMIVYWVYSRAVLILLMVVEDGTILIVRAKQSVSYHFELMWLILLNLLVGVSFMRTIWLDSRFADEWICTAFFKDRSANVPLVDGPGGEEGDTPLDSHIFLPTKARNFIDKMRSKIKNFLKPRKKQSLQSSTVSSCESSDIESSISSTNTPTTKQSSMALSSESSSEEEGQQMIKIKRKKHSKSHKTTKHKH